MLTMRRLDPEAGEVVLDTRDLDIDTDLVRCQRNGYDISRVGGVEAGSDGCEAGFTIGAVGKRDVFRTDPGVHDGRFANNGWLQELSKPLTRLTWENAALVGPADAARLGLENGDVVEIQRAGDVIPRVVERLPSPGKRRGPEFRMPDDCPSCATPTARVSRPWRPS